MHFLDSYNIGKLTLFYCVILLNECEYQYECHIIFIADSNQFSFQFQFINLSSNRLQEVNSPTFVVFFFHVPMVITVEPAFIKVCIWELILYIGLKMYNEITRLTF